MALFIRAFNDSGVKRLPLKKIRDTIENVFSGENIISADVNAVIINDKAIHELNIQYLKHDYPTDVISFLLSEKGGDIEGEIYISADTARRQAIEYKVSLSCELARLAAHGALHLAGYDDKTNKQRSIMSELETKYISLNR